MEGENNRKIELRLKVVEGRHGENTRTQIISNQGKEFHLSKQLSFVSHNFCFIGLKREVTARRRVAVVMHLLVDRFTSSHFLILVGRLTAESWLQGGSLTVVVSGSYIRIRNALKWLKSILVDAFIIGGRESFWCSDH